MKFNVTNPLKNIFFLKLCIIKKIGAASGLGSKNNKDLIVKQKKKPFFNWISANENIATARGGGGGLALWRRVV